MKQSQRLVPITRMSIHTPLEVSSEIFIEIEGYLPDPAWEMFREQVSIDETKQVVSIKIYGKRDPSLMAAQVVKNFRKSISLILKTKGKWIIQCNDKNLEIEI